MRVRLLTLAGGAELDPGDGWPGSPGWAHRHV